jgi:hypothetical protein
MTMANVHSMAKVRPGKHVAKLRIRRPTKLLKRAKVAPHRSTDGGQRENQRTIRLSEPLRTFLTSERDGLIKAEAVLLCSATAMEEDHPLKGPYYPDVVGLVADLLRRQVVYLDDLLLDGVLPAG